MVKAEGAAPQASIVQESLRASPQLAALANGVAAHAMDYDFTFMRAQSIAALIPAILPVAEITNATPAEIVAALSSAQRLPPASCAPIRTVRRSTAGMRPAWSACWARRRPVRG